mmetsp:Transcript_9237/g.8302  ORF Transcript_9237/g.8302 Transcript_9237/m.8302 type:complete len:172 (-) Transcript_9237:28-543(-)
MEIDDEQSVLIKSSFEKYMKHNPDSCKYEDIEKVLKTVLERRIKMYDDIRAQIENKQNYHCKQPYYSKTVQPDEYLDEYELFLNGLDWNYLGSIIGDEDIDNNYFDNYAVYEDEENNSVNDTEEDVITSTNKMVITDLVETESEHEEIEFIDRRYIAIFIHIIGYLYVILK